MNRFAATLRRHRGQPLRLVLTVLFLVVGLAVSVLALSLQHDLARFFQTMDRPLPLWVGETRSMGGGWYSPIYHSDLTQADLKTVEQLLPKELWTPYFTCEDSSYDKLLRVPGQDLVGIRRKVLARPSLLSFFRTPILLGRIPSDAESQTKKFALISEESAQSLFGLPVLALGKVLRPEQNNFPALTGDFEVCGVFQTPTEVQVQFGHPDVLLVPDLALARTMASPTGGQVFPARMAFDPDRVDPKLLADQVVPRLKAAHPDLNLDSVQTWRGGNESAVPPGWLDETHRQIDGFFLAATLLTILFLVVSCLSVLSFLFVSITGQSREIALERALGRPFRYFLGQAFLQGSLMVLAASVLAVALDVLLLPLLADVFRNTLGTMLPDSRGQPNLDGATVLGLCLGASALAGLVGMIPLIPYRKVPIAVQIKDES